MTALAAPGPLVPPPGQMQAFPPAPKPRASSYRVVYVLDGTPRHQDPVRDLTIAAGRAHAAAARHGEAWIVAADGSSAHVTSDGDVAPAFDGWPLLAAQILTNRKAPS